ncbi:MAG: hypothetical protein AAF125_21100, partial [Chloroflexota bacterium]
PPETAEPAVVREDGTLQLSRKVSRLDRFQVSRFTSWREAPPPTSDAAFEYVIDRPGVAQADAQEIQVDHIRAFLGRVLGDDPIPERIETVLSNYRGDDDTSTVTLTQMVVLQTTSTDVMDEIFETPELRRYLGRRFGDRAVAVRADQWGDLQTALREMGFDVVVNT